MGVPCRGLHAALLGCALRQLQFVPSCRPAVVHPAVVTASSPRPPLHLQQSGFLRPHQLRYDVSSLVTHEYRRQLHRQADLRKKEIQAAKEAAKAVVANGGGTASTGGDGGGSNGPAAGGCGEGAPAPAAADAAAPGFRHRGPVMPIGRAALEELRLKLAAKQMEVRRAVEAQQEEIMQVSGVGRVGGWVGGCSRGARDAGVPTKRLGGLDAVVQRGRARTAAGVSVEPGGLGWPRGRPAACAGDACCRRGPASPWCLPRMPQNERSVSTIDTSRPLAPPARRPRPPAPQPRPTPPLTHTPQMPEKKYKNMLRSHRSQRIELARKVGGPQGRAGSSSVSAVPGSSGSPASSASRPAGWLGGAAGWWVPALRCSC